MGKTKQTEAPAKVKKDYNIKSKAIGILEMFVVVSIAFSTYVVYFGVEDRISQMLLVPQAGWVVWTLVQRFTK